MRRQPVAFALVDAAFLADSKFRKLRQRLPESRDFNSAVGAWLIVLTSARRNGLPSVDAAEEADDDTYLSDLLAVGLLCESGVPDKPFAAWAPARRKYPSDLATDAPSATNATYAPKYSVSEPSTPLPSTLLTSQEQDAREDFDALDRFHELTGWNPWTMDWRREELNALQNDYGRAATIAAINAEWDAKHDRKGLVKGATVRLARNVDREKGKEREPPPRATPAERAEADRKRAVIAAELGAVKEVSSRAD